MAYQPPPASVVQRVGYYRLADFARRVNAIPSDGRITSWWRSSSDNARVGGCQGPGVPRPLCTGVSKHVLGLALDVVPYGSWSKLAAEARALGLRVIDEGDHLHLQV